MVISTSQHVNVNENRKFVNVFVICINKLFISMISACNCNELGSTGSCDDTGICNCKDYFKNDKCDACTDGPDIFPNCGNYVLFTLQKFKC